MLAVSENMTFECKRSRFRKARQSFHNLLKIVFHTCLVYYQVPLMIGEIPTSDAYHYMDAHDTETVCCFVAVILPMYARYLL